VHKQGSKRANTRGQLLSGVAFRQATGAIKQRVKQEEEEVEQQ